VNHYNIRHCNTRPREKEKEKREPTERELREENDRDNFLHPNGGQVGAYGTSGQDTSFRRTWDRDEFEKETRDRARAEGEDELDQYLSGQTWGFGGQKPMNLLNRSPSHT
jgi:hypothetical protein